MSKTPSEKFQAGLGAAEETFSLPPAKEPGVEETSEASLVNRSSWGPGTLLGSRYMLESVLGSGGMGEVWKARDLKLEIPVALKSLRTGHSRSGRSILRREVRTARQISSAQVCRIYDLVEIDGQELISMEYVEGRTLRQELEERAPLELGEAFRIASQLLAGLEAIHQEGIIHRDLKPSNVMLTPNGRVVVMDFGVAGSLTQDSDGLVW